MIGLDRAGQTKKLNRTGYRNNSYVVRQAQGFKWWNELSSQEKMHLVEQVTSLDLKFAGKLFDNYAREAAQTPKHKLVPPKVKTIPKTISEMENVRIAKQMGECSLRNGEVQAPRISPLCHSANYSTATTPRPATTLLPCSTPPTRNFRYVRDSCSRYMRQAYIHHPAFERKLGADSASWPNYTPAAASRSSRISSSISATFARSLLK